MGKRRLKASLAEAVKDWRDSARCLRAEIDRGVTIRQSAESKLARADVLESNANQIERLIKISEVVS